MTLFKKIKHLPIASKLTLVCVIISLVSLIVAMSAIIIYDRYNFEQIIKDELVVLASVIGNRSVPAIVFDDTELANSNLKPLVFQETIVSACIYKAEQHSDHTSSQALASFPSNDVICPSYRPSEILFIESDDKLFIGLVQPITQDNNIIGYLYIQSSNSQLRNLQKNHFLVLLMASLLSTLVAYFLSNAVSRWISSPLRELEKTARIIANEDDFSHRADKHSEDEIGQVVDSFNQMLDVIEQEDADLRESEEKFRLISSSSKVGIFQLDIDGNCVYANEEILSITGLQDFTHITTMWRKLIHNDDVELFSNKINTMLANKQPINVNVRINQSGVKWITGHIGLLKRSDETLIGYLGTISDITEIKNAQIQLEQMAFYDTLTGLANRRLFRNRLEHVINNLNRDNSCLGLILIDLDNFKNVNDSLGHDSGDTLLTLIAERLQLCVRASDTVARLGGDEFAIILPGINDTTAVSNVAKKILETLKLPITLNETEIRITASAGLSIAPDDSNNAETLIKNADLALYKAKDEGRNKYKFYTSEMNTELIAHLQLIQDLRLAIDAQEFSLVYQPQVDLKKGTLIGFEALLRWHSSTQGSISPMAFIPAAEETGLIIPLGRWVISTACKHLRHMYDTKLISEHVVMTVNISILQFQDEDLINFIQSVLLKYNLVPSQFEVELTETVLMENLDEALTKLQALKQLGILISIDDFGTGYSSLGYLKRLPVNIVKVDRSFVMDIPNDKDDMEITAAVIAMAHNLNYKVVAEGVETEQQLEFLESCDCDYGQGYLFSKPLRADQLEYFCHHFCLDDLRTAKSTKTIEAE